jgi:hypothetical protein
MLQGSLSRCCLGYSGVEAVLSTFLLVPGETLRLQDPKHGLNGGVSELVFKRCSCFGH